MLRRIFETKSKEVAVEWRKVKIEELHNLQAYFSPKIVRTIRQRPLKERNIQQCKGDIRNS
jgi:hypothetical protein